MSGVASRPRRRALRALAASATALVATGAGAQRDPYGSQQSRCVSTPEQAAGPFFVDERLERSDIRGDARGGGSRPGVPFALALRLSAMTGRGCEPLRGAAVDVWHCDAAGLYSDEDGLRTNGSQFLRGYQLSD